MSKYDSIRLAVAVDIYDRILVERYRPQVHVYPASGSSLKVRGKSLFATG